MDIKEVAKINEPESKAGRLKEVIADIEANNGKLTREQAMIAYCSGKKINVVDGREIFANYMAWLDEQVSKVSWDSGKTWEKSLFISSFSCDKYMYELVKEPPMLVDGLTACEAYRAGKKVVRNYLVYQKGIAMHPDFTLDGWEIID